MKTCISVKSLYDKYGVKLSHTYITTTYQDENNIYYDLFTNDGCLVCMDGEACVVVNENDKCVNLQSDEEDFLKFKLSTEEFEIATFTTEFPTNKIYNEDCLVGMSKLYKKHGECIDLIITDPPYGIEYQSNGSLKKKDKIKNDDVVDYKTFGELAYKLLKPNSHSYFFTRYDVYPEHYKQLQEAGFTIKNLLISEKMQVGGLGDLQASFSNNIELVIFAQKGRRKFNHTKLIKTTKPVGKSPNRYTNPTGEYKKRLPVLWKTEEGYPPSVLNSSQLKDNPHPTPKNPAYLEWLIQLSSNEGDVVLDPFMGSGNTALACVNTNRKYIGYELDNTYHEYTLNILK